jgi:hypothetical protein
MMCPVWCATVSNNSDLQRKFHPGTIKIPFVTTHEIGVDACLRIIEVTRENASTNNPKLDEYSETDRLLGNYA